MAINLFDEQGNAHELSQIYAVDENLVAHPLLVQTSDFPGFAVEYFAGTGATGSMAREYRDVGIQRAITANGFNAPHGHHAAGWSGSDGATYAEGQGIDGSGLAAQVLGLTALWDANIWTLHLAGNGSTSGGDPATPMTWGEAHSAPANPFAKSFTVTYDWNGGGGSKSSDTVASTFREWLGSDGNTYGPGDTLPDLTSVQNGSGTLTAQWNAGSVTLPASGTLEGYDFMGWSVTDGLEEGELSGTYTPTGNVTLHACWKSQKINHSTAAEWAANPADLKVAADDISANGTSSAYYAEFKAFMDADASFPITLRNVDSYTSVAADKVMQMRIVGINCKTKASGGTAGLTFMAKKAHPKANVMNSSGSTSGGWPSMPLRTEMNSGTFWGTLPAAWQSVIAEVSNTSYGPSKTQVTSSDKMWLPSWYELCGSDSSSSYKTNDGPQFPWFASKGTTNSAVQSTLANMYQTNSGAQPSGLGYTDFWARSVCPSSTSYFVNVSSDGSHDRSYPYYAYAVLPCFSL